MQDMDTDLMAFDDFFSSATDEIDDGERLFTNDWWLWWSCWCGSNDCVWRSTEIWSVPREPLGSEDHDLLDAEDLQPLDPDEDKARLEACCVGASKPIEPAIKSEPPSSRWLRVESTPSLSSSRTR